MSKQKNTEPAIQPSTARRALLTGGAVGLAALAAETFGTAQPASASSGPAFIYVPSLASQGKSGDDGANIQSYINTLFANGGGAIQLGPYTYNMETGLTLNESVSENTTQQSIPLSIFGCGPSTILQAAATFPASTAVVFKHRQRGYGSQVVTPAPQPVGVLGDFMIDGQLATATNLIGLDIGDGWGHVANNITISNFGGTGHVGCRHSNLENYSEKNLLRLNLLHNTVGLSIDTSTQGCPADCAITGSHEYNWYYLAIYALAGQTGIQVVNGSWCNGCYFSVHGNFQASSTQMPSPWASLYLDGTSGSDGTTHISACTFDWALEVTTVNTHMPMTIQYASANGGMTNNTGHMTWQFGNTWTPSNAVIKADSTSQFQFTGRIGGDANLAGTEPPVGAPVSGTNYVNKGNPAVVTIAGGTVSQITLNGTATGLTSGAFYVPANGTFGVTFSAAPIWTWTPAVAS